MRPCPRCALPCPDQAATCPVCGTSLVPEFGQTSIGHRGPEAPRPEVPAPAPVPAPSMKSTMLGIAPLASAPPTSPGAPEHPAGGSPSRSGALRSTMLGIAPVAPAPATGAAPAASTTQSMSGGIPKGTLLGMPPVGPAAEEAAPAPAIAGHAPAAASDPIDRKKTILGVARPGIAPVNPGVSRPPGPSVQGADWGPAPSPPPPPPPPGEALAPDFDVPKPVAKHRRIPLAAALAIVAAAALFTAAAVALFLYRARGAIQTNVVVGNDGREELVLTCVGCEDGTTVRSGASSATFRGRRATLRLSRELAVGDNQLAVTLERRPGKRETVELSVPVEYRVRAETTDLAKTPPVVSVVVRAVKGSAVVIDGKAAALAEDGTAKHVVDVSRALTGAEAGLQTLEMRIPYTVTPPGSSAQKGDVSVRIGIAPLVLHAPGDSIVIDTPTFVLAGRTAKNAEVAVEGRPITVDPGGQFAQVMGVSAVGETTVVVRASAPDHAPRLVPVRVKRVASLTAEATRLRAQSTTTYSEVASAPDAHRGKLVLFDGRLLEARAESFTSILLVDVKSGCSAPPCLLRVSWGSKAPFAADDPVTTYGAVTGSVEGPRGTRIPSVAASFVVKGRP